jgi:hypothetical protein
MKTTQKSPNARRDKSRPSTKPTDSSRTRTEVEGQNPRQNDAPDHDEHHDESRVNLAGKKASR